MNLIVNPNNTVERVDCKDNCEMRQQLYGCYVNDIIEDPRCMLVDG